jgi:DNA-binding transcriptional LysR family regulator
MRLHFDLADFRLFANIAEEKNLTRGAARTFLSVPAASNRIKHLEEMLGVKLFDRSPQGLHLTKAGETYLQHARIVLSQLELLTGDLQVYTEGLTGQLRLLANSTAITEYLPTVVASYLHTHPDVHIDVRERMSDEIVRGVREGAADLGIISGSVPTDGLQSVPFVSSRLVLIAPLQHSILQEGVVAFRDALDYVMVSLLESSAAHAFLARAAAAIHKPMSIRVQVASYDATFRMVEAGAGIAIVPQACCDRLRDRFAIGLTALSDPWAIRTFQICAQDFQGLSSFAQDFATSVIDSYRIDGQTAADAL